MAQRSIDFIKKIIVSLISGVFSIYRDIFTNKGLNIAIYYPVFYDLSELIHHYYSAMYFLPMDSKSRTVFFVSEKLKKTAGDIKEIPPPDYMGDCLWGKGMNIEVKFTNDNPALMKLLLQYRPMNLFFWAKVSETRLQSKLVVCFEQRINVVNVDRHTTWGCYNYPGFRYSLVRSNELTKQRNIAHRKFVAYIESLPVFSKAYVFGTGPSIETAFGYDFSDGYRIVCNTIIKNKELMEHIKPHFMIAGDAIYHFGISKYACRFRRDLENFLNSYKCLFLIPESYYNNFIFHYENIKKFTLPIPYTALQINLSMKKRFEIKSVHNILNQLLLPLASSLCDNIFLLGFDGRKSTDKYFWKSTDSVNYEDLKGYHQKAHPGFFKGIDYEEYANIQSELAETIMSLGERMGKKYYCLNESSNKALQQRYIGNKGI